MRTTAASLAGIALAAMVVCAQGGAGSEAPVGRMQPRFVPAGDYNWRGATTKALVTSVWYPASAAAAMTGHFIGPPGSPLFRLGTWMDRGPRAEGAFPLILLSHGTGGSSEIMAWLGAGLASRGYVVAAVNHPGNNALDEPYTAEGFLLWWERARDVSTVLDFLLRDERFAPMIDRRRIGVAGFSLGGYTAIVLAGGVSDASRLREACRAPNAEGCVEPPEFPHLFERWRELEATSAEFREATRQAGRSYRDERIRSAFAIAPAGGEVFVPESLRRITIPIQIVAGRDDRMAPIRSNAQLLAGAIPTAHLTLLPDVGHYTFLATCTDAGRRAQRQLCEDSRRIDRDNVHRITLDAAADFFSKTLQ